MERACDGVVPPESVANTQKGLHPVFDITNPMRLTDFTCALHPRKIKGDCV